MYSMYSCKIRGRPGFEMRLARRLLVTFDKPELGQYYTLRRDREQAICATQASRVALASVCDI